MRSPLYKRALARDLDVWIEAGLVPPGSRDAILGGAGSDGADAPAILAGLAAVLFGFAAISFVAANWGAMPALVRAGLAFAALGVALWATTAAFARRWNTAGDALALVSALMFGVSLMLIAQVFHIQAHYPRGILIWTGAAAATAFAFRSRPPLVASAVLSAIWLVQEHANDLPIGPLWAYLPVWACLAILANRRASLVSAHVLSLALGLWFAIVAVIAASRNWLASDEAVGLLGLAGLTMAVGAGLARDRGAFGAGVFAGWSALAAAVAGFMLQFATRLDFESGDVERTLGWATLALLGLGALLALLYWRRRADEMDLRVAGVLAVGGLALALGPRLDEWLGSELAAEFVLGAAFLGAAGGAVVLGAQLERRSILAVGVAAFFCQAIYVYARALGDLLNTSAFFLVGAILFGGVALVIARERKRLLGTGDRS